MGLALDRYSIIFFEEKNISLKQLKLPKNHFKPNLFLEFLVGGPSSTWIMVRWETGTSNLSSGAIWQLSNDPYHV